MTDDTIRVTTEPTEKDDQNDDTEDESCRVEDPDRTIKRSEVTSKSEEDKNEVNVAIEDPKADHEILKKKLSDSMLESDESVADDTLSEGISFDQKTSRAKLSGEQFEVGGSSTKQEDQNDGTDDEIRASIVYLSRCVRDVDRTIKRIEATPTTEEEAEEVNAALELLKVDFDILKTKLSELKLRFGESAGSSAEQEDQNDAIEDEIRANISNLSCCVQNIDRAMARMQATPRTKEEMKELNAAIQLLKADQGIVKKNLGKWNLELGKSVGSLSVADDTGGHNICQDQSIVKKKLSGSQSAVVGSSSPKEDKAITASSELTQQDDVDEEKMEKLKAFIEMFDTDEDSVKKKLNELQREFSKSIGSSSVADNAIITDSKLTEQEQEIRLAYLKKRFGDSLFDVWESSNNPKDSKEMQKPRSETQGDLGSDSGESMNEELRRAIAESTADISFTEGGIVSQKLMDWIDWGEEFVHASSEDTEEVEDVPIEGSKGEISRPKIDLDQAMQQVEDVLRQVRLNLPEDPEAVNSQRRLTEIQPAIGPETVVPWEAVTPREAVIARDELQERSNGLREHITAVVAGLAALCTFFCGRAKERKERGENKD